MLFYASESGLYVDVCVFTVVELMFGDVFVLFVFSISFQCNTNCCALALKGHTVTKCLNTLNKYMSHMFLVFIEIICHS